jgi:GNAT superfamily N-acetyltransferase
VYSDEVGIKNATKLARRHRLFVNGWNLKDSYKDILSGYDTKTVSVAMYFDGEKPVGICLIQNNYHGTAYETSFFVRGAYRRKGIAKQLFETLRCGFTDKEIHLYSGNKASHVFFNGLKRMYRNVRYYSAW